MVDEFVSEGFNLIKIRKWRNIIFFPRRIAEKTRRCRWITANLPSQRHKVEHMACTQRVYICHQEPLHLTFLPTSSVKRDSELPPRRGRPHRPSPCGRGRDLSPSPMQAERPGRVPSRYAQHVECIGGSQAPTRKPRASLPSLIQPCARNGHVASDFQQGGAAAEHAPRERRRRSLQVKQSNSRKDERWSHSINKPIFPFHATCSALATAKKKRGYDLWR